MRHDHDTDDESIDINLRSIHEVAARMVVLAAVIRRAVLELPLDEDEEEDDLDSVDGERFDAITALMTGAPSTATTPRELEFVTAPIGQLGEETALAASWQIEALAALAWTTQTETDPPAPWQQADPGPILSSIPEPGEELSGFAAALVLLDEESIALERERAELWSWRCAIDEELGLSRGRERQELIEILRETVEEAVHAGLLPGGDEDFLVRIRSFASADAETKALIAEIASQRLHALNWLCGYGESWDTVPLNI